MPAASVASAPKRLLLASLSHRQEHELNYTPVFFNTTHSKESLDLYLRVHPPLRTDTRTKLCNQILKHRPHVLRELSNNHLA